MGLLPESVLVAPMTGMYAHKGVHLPMKESQEVIGFPLAWWGGAAKAEAHAGQQRVVQRVNGLRYAHRV